MGEELEEGQTVTVCVYITTLLAYIMIYYLFLLNNSQCVYVNTSKWIHINLLLLCVYYTRKELIKLYGRFPSEHNTPCVCCICVCTCVHSFV